MENEICFININDKEHEDLYPDIVSIEVEDDEQLACVFNIRLAIRLQKDGTWTWVDDERLNLWNKVGISAGFADNIVDVITGYITQVKPYFDAELSQCYLDVKGMDGTVLMNTVEKLKDWPNKKDSDIASEIFTEFGFSPEVEDTEVVHDEQISTIIQRETDIQFLKRLARRNGFECFVRNTTGYFRLPDLNGKPQKILSVQFGPESNLSYFRTGIDALKLKNVEMHQLDLQTKEHRDVIVDMGQQKQLGMTPASDLYSVEVEPSKVYMKHTIANGQPAMQALCQAQFDESEWMVQGEGEIMGGIYQDVLKARELVTIKGAGKTFSGIYYVTKVRHSFSDNGYIQHFNVKRNALNPDGTEDFGSGGSLPGSASL